MVDTMPFQPDGAGYQEELRYETSVMTPKFGSSRIRREGLNNVSKAKLSWVLSGADYDTFLTFYYTTLVSGSLPFLVTLRTVVKTCQFISPLSVEHVDGITNYVSANVEIIS